MSGSASHALSTGKNTVSSGVEFSRETISGVMIPLKYDREDCCDATVTEVEFSDTLKKHNHKHTEIWRNVQDGVNAEEHPIESAPSVDPAVVSPAPW